MRTQVHEESIISNAPVRSKHSFKLTDFSTGLAAFAYTEVSISRIVFSPSKAWHELIAGFHARERNIKRLILVGFALTFLLAFLLTFLRQPPLPRVEISGDIHVKGESLVHTEGFWYVYNGEGQLVAIPDRKVTAVRVFVVNE